MTVIWILAGFIVIMLLWSYIEQKTFGVSGYTVLTDKTGPKFHGLTFVLLADLHNRSFGRNNQRLVRKIKEVKPDFILAAGDIITKKKTCIPGNAYSLMKELSLHFPIFYSYGNHEQDFEDLKEQSHNTDNSSIARLYSSWLSYKEQLTELGVQFLDNKSIGLMRNDKMLTITGLTLDHNFFLKRKAPVLDPKDITGLVGKKDRDGYHILLAHNPIYFKEYVCWGADLILSGHVHGGLVRIPFIGGIISPQVRLFPKYDAGRYRENGQEMIVSRGLGTHSGMPRLFNRPELVVITLKYIGGKETI